jgi:hypothetical protein
MERELKRGRYVHFRVGEAERLALERLCRLEQSSVSETMRLALRELARQRGAWPLPQGGLLRRCADDTDDNM